VKTRVRLVLLNQNNKVKICLLCELLCCKSLKLLDLIVNSKLTLYKIRLVLKVNLIYHYNLEILLIFINHQKHMCLVVTPLAVFRGHELIESFLFNIAITKLCFNYVN
jgi:hypothetical protein